MRTTVKMAITETMPMLTGQQELVPAKWVWVNQFEEIVYGVEPWGISICVGGIYVDANRVWVYAGECPTYRMLLNCHSMACVYARRA